MRIKIEQVNISIFSNQILLELKYCLFQFIQIKMTILIDLTYPSFIKYHNVKSLEKNFIINQLILTLNNTKKLENEQQGKVKIILQDLY